MLLSSTRGRPQLASRRFHVRLLTPAFRSDLRPHWSLSKADFTTKSESGTALLQWPPGGTRGLAQGHRGGESLPSRTSSDRRAAKKAGIVAATRGAHGGYTLARPAAEITMDQVVLALEGHIAPMDCFVDDRSGRVLCSHPADAQLCATKLLWTRVQMGVIRSLQHTTLAELIDFSACKTSLPPDITENHGRLEIKTFTSIGDKQIQKVWICMAAR